MEDAKSIGVNVTFFKMQLYVAHIRRNGFGLDFSDGFGLGFSDGFDREFSHGSKPGFSNGFDLDFSGSRTVQQSCKKARASECRVFRKYYYLRPVLALEL